jgi:hypothetical protein
MNKQKEKSASVLHTRADYNANSVENTSTDIIPHFDTAVKILSKRVICTKF